MSRSRRPSAGDPRHGRAYRRTAELAQDYVGTEHRNVLVVLTEFDNAVVCSSTARIRVWGRFVAR
ncbi:hypothetical protein [Streptomyces canus]|uniref:hypothetical protein n=1 Tax=Streptomyces canus TaxID=58343 RepID=UPI0037158E45